MRRFAALFMVAGALLLVASGTASAKGDPQGPHVKDWFCIVDLNTWHCVAPGVLKNFGRVPSAPSLNWVCDDPAQNDPGGICGEPFFRVSFGPPAGTHYAGTENGIRADLYAGQPCPQSRPEPIDFDGDGVPDYVFCHHYGE